jgi:hypothetical protein
MVHFVVKRDPCVNRDQWVIGHFFVPNYFPLGNKDKGGYHVLYLGFFGGKNVAIFLRKKELKLPYLDHKFSHVTSIKAWFPKN